MAGISGTVQAQPAAGSDTLGAAEAPDVDIRPVREFLRQRGEVDEWGCEGLFCNCSGGANSESCKIVAPYCADDIVCIGDECSCVWGGGP